MAKTISSLSVRVGGDVSALSASFGAGAKSARGFSASIGAAGASIGGLVSRAAGLGLLAGAVAGAAGALGGIGKGLKLAAEFEQTAVAMKVMTGDAAIAGGVMADLTRFAAETPFEFPELATAGKKLLAFGSGAGDVVRELRTIGDISSGIGAPIGEIAELYGKARVQGTLFMEDINQLTGRGIPIIGQLAKQFNVAESAVKGLVSSGRVSFQNLQAAFRDMTASGGQFAGMMKEQSNTLAGTWSTLTDTINNSLRSIGETVARETDAKQFMKDAAASIDVFGKMAHAALGGATADYETATAAVKTAEAAFAQAPRNLEHRIQQTEALIASLQQRQQAARDAVIAAPGLKLAGSTLASNFGAPDALARMAGDLTAMGAAANVPARAFSDISARLQEATYYLARFKEMQAITDRATAAAAAAAATQEQAAAAAMKQKEANAATVTQRLAAMNHEYRLLGLTSMQRQIEELRLLGATAEEAGKATSLLFWSDVHAKAAEDAAAAISAQQDMFDEAKRIVESNRTAAERTYDELKKIDEMFKAGALGQKDYDRAKTAARERGAAEAAAEAGPSRPDPGNRSVAAREMRFTSGFTRENTGTLPVMKVAQQQLAEQKRQTKAVERLERKIEPVGLFEM